MPFNLNNFKNCLHYVCVISFEAGNFTTLEENCMCVFGGSYKSKIFVHSENVY